MNLFLLLLVLAFTTHTAGAQCCTGSDENEAGGCAAGSAIRQSIRFHVDGMNTGLEAAKVEMRLQNLDGVFSAKSKSRSGQVEVVYDPVKLTRETLISQLENQGAYQVAELEAIPEILLKERSCCGASGSGCCQ